MEDREHDMNRPEGQEPDQGAKPEAEQGAMRGAEQEATQGLPDERPSYPLPPVQPYRPPQMSSFRSPTGDPPGTGAGADPFFQAGGPSFSDPEPEPEPPPIPEQPAYVPPRHSEPPRGRSILGPVILILLGLLFLAQTLGWLSWSVWETLWRFWPAWLILIGLDMLLGRRSRWGSLVAMGIVVTVIGGVFYFTSGFRTEARAVAVGDTVAISQPADGASEAKVEISSGVSELTLRSAPLSETVIQGSVVPLRSERIDQSYRLDGSTGYYRLSSEMRGISPSFGPSSRGTWDLELTESMPVALALSTGVGKAEIDLSGVQLTDLRVESGVGETTLILPASGTFTGRVQAGVGEITIQIPDGQAARIEVETGLGDVSTSGDFSRDGDVYTTPAYNGAKDFIDLHVEGGVGSVRLEIDG